MKYLKYLAILSVLMIPLSVTPAHAQIAVGIGIGGPGYAYGPPPCAYGYYGYAPYACAPYGYYGPAYFNEGIFIGAGPWFRGGWGYRGYGYRGGYGYGGIGYRGGYGYRGGVGGYRAPAGGFRGGESFHGSVGGGGGFHGGGGGSFHGGGRTPVSKSQICERSGRADANRRRPFLFWHTWLEPTHRKSAMNGARVY